MNSIFTFDHGQKKLNKAIGVQESYMDDLQEQMINILRNYLFDENKDLKDDISPSMLVEACLSEFSYSQLVIISSFYLHNKVKDFAKTIDQKMDGLREKITKIALNSDDLPIEVKNFFDNLENGNSEHNPIDSDSLPPEVKQFLDSLIERKFEQEDDDDND